MLVATQFRSPTTKRIFNATEGAVSTYRSAKLKETELDRMATKKLGLNYQSHDTVGSLIKIVRPYMSLVLTDVYNKGDRYTAVCSALSMYIRGTKEPE